MSPASFDELLQRLIEAKVEFVLENLKRIAEVAVAAGGHVQQGEALLGSAFSIAAAIAGGEQVTIETDLGRLDVVQGLEGVPSYEELRSRATAQAVVTESGPEPLIRTASTRFSRTDSTRIV